MCTKQANFWIFLFFFFFSSQLPKDVMSCVSCIRLLEEEKKMETQLFRSFPSLEWRSFCSPCNSVCQSGGKITKSSSEAAPKTTDKLGGNVATGGCLESILWRKPWHYVHLSTPFLRRERHKRCWWWKDPSTFGHWDSVGNETKLPEDCHLVTPTALLGALSPERK